MRLEARWQISDAISTSDPRPRPCLKRRGARKAAPASSRSSSARRPASARPTRCCRPRAPGRRTATTSSSAWSRPTAARRPKRCSTGFEIIPRRRDRLQGPARSRRWTSTRIIARRPQIVLVDELAHTNAPGSRHPKRYLDVEELLNARHRRLHHRQHPAHRKPERRRRADHPRARARDRAGFGLRSRRRRRAGRPHARRPDPAPEGRQGLRSRSRPSARSSTSSRRPT